MMMRYLLCTVFCLCLWELPCAQEVSFQAFSESYRHEYNQDYALAIEALEKHYQRTSYSMNLRLGWLNYLAEDYPQSKRYYQKAVAIAPNGIEARLGYVLPLAAEGNWDQVAGVYHDILELSPSHNLVLYRLALLHYNQNSFEQARIHILRLVTLYPFDYDSQLLLAKIEIAQGNILEAKAALINCLQYNPSSKEALDIWGRIK